MFAQAFRIIDDGLWIESGGTPGLDCTGQSFGLPKPPADEQQRIVEYIEHETKSLNIALTEREIALTQEYRTRLTADLVTGKLDVREATAKVPAPPAVSAAEPIADEALEEPESEGEGD